MVMKKGSVIPPMRREYISMKTVINAKTTRYKRSNYWATEYYNRDVVQVGKRAVSTTSTFGAI